ncbi:MAG: hydrogenase [Nitrospinae bacterium]|nr:hydrogenase [Nitrospinota bacterium]
MSAAPLKLANGQARPLAEIPLFSFEEFRAYALDRAAGGGKVSALFAAPVNGAKTIVALVSLRLTGEIEAVLVKPEGYRSLTPEIPSLHLFEREMAEEHGIIPEGHPWFKPVRYHKPFNGGEAPVVGVTEYFTLEGSQAHEVAVGPVHAGVIEPGHFRFQCHGEKVYHLEISLGYQHRGIERALAGGPHGRTLSHMETLAGDTTIGHATAHCEVVEALAGMGVSPDALEARAVMLELERLANHAGDLGMLAQDVGYLPVAAFCGRSRGDFLNLSQVICGSRFGRGFMVPGGVRYGMDAAMLEDFSARLARAWKDFTDASALLWTKPSVLARFENTGTIPFSVCRALGMVGPAARACGEPRDVRRDFPSGAYRARPMGVASLDSGDVFARARVRWLEAEQSLRFIQSVLKPWERSGPPDSAALAPETMAAAMVEGWRGEILHTAVTGADGRFAAYKVVDPSFFNWTGLAYALRGQEISDFPLCNKSFNLSYCGFDL